MLSTAFVSVFSGEEGAAIGWVSTAKKVYARKNLNLFLGHVLRFGHLCKKITVGGSAHAIVNGTGA